MRPPRPWMLSLLAAGLASCASYNAMWNAEQHARDARRLEQLGQTAEARAQWAQAAAKARAGRTAKALVLQAEGLAYSGSCQDAATPLARAQGSLTEVALRERMDLADAVCALAAGDLARADAALAMPLASRNAERRSRAEFVAGQAALVRWDYDAAIVHFNRSRVPGAAGRALVGQQRALITRAAQLADLKPIAAELSRLRSGASGTEDASHLVDLLTQVLAVAETPGARFRVAELARDSLQAPALAGRLFLETATGDTASLFAPKALIAALSVLPDRRDSIVALLDARYAASPYTRAFHGDPSVAYVAAEDSLAREMGPARSAGRPAVSAVELFGTTFQNPILLAAGTAGFGCELDHVLDLDSLGGIVTKAVTPEPRQGHPALRVAEFRGGMLNAVGLANPGVERVAEHELPWLAQRLARARIIVNVAGATVADYVRVIERLTPLAAITAFEVNASCPNTQAGGLEFGAEPASLAELVRACRQVSTRPLAVKLSPVLPDIPAMARVARDAGAEAVSLVNTMPGLLDKRLGNGSGGLSGPALLPIGVLATRRVHELVGMPVIGVGGVRNVADAREYLAAGAALVAIGTAALADPRVPERIARELARG